MVFDNLTQEQQAQVIELEAVKSEEYTYVKDEIRVNGIDRIDSSKGYSIDNCVPCCTMCNRMKLDYKLSDFINHVHKIANHYKSSTTIPQGSTEQTNGSGNGEIPEKEYDIV